MTPNNIINMARIKGLTGIAITDHNSVENLNAFIAVAKEKDLEFLPGIEVTTSEEIHVLIFFDDFEAIDYLRRVLQKKLPDLKNHEDLFGSQLIYNNEDAVVGKEEKLLTNATRLSLKEAVALAREIDGVLVPAHVDRKSFSILSNLGFIPPEFDGAVIEVSKNLSKNEIHKKIPAAERYKIMQNSDAHQLIDISEKIQANRIALPEEMTILQKLKYDF